MQLAQIFRTVRSLGSFRGAVVYLKQHSPEQFSNLCECTVRKWFKPGSFIEITPVAEEAVCNCCSFAGSRTLRATFEVMDDGIPSTIVCCLCIRIEVLFVQMRAMSTQSQSRQQMCVPKTTGELLPH